jgi:hypothetical protein
MEENDDAATDEKVVNGEEAKPEVSEVGPEKDAPAMVPTKYGELDVLDQTDRTDFEYVKHALLMPSSRSVGLAVLWLGC